MENKNLADEAKIYVEPYYKYSFMRFDFGTVKNVKRPNDTTLSEIPREDNIQFRVKIVDESEKRGRILAHATNLKPKSEDEKEKDSILPINFVDLDQELWKVSFTDDRPFLEINSKIRDAKEFVKNSPTVHSVILPSALRIVLSRIINDETDHDEYGDLWQNKWIRFVKNNLFVKDKIPVKGDEEIEKDNWLDEVVSVFTRKFHLFDRFQNKN